MKKTLTLIALLLSIASSAFAGEPLKVLKSRIGPSYQVDVSTYAAELAEWKAHMAKVAADKAAGVPKEKANAPYPQPSAPPLVAGAVDETGKPNFQIVDDSPSPDDVLSAKKTALITAVRIAENAAIRRLIPEGKVRTYGARQNSIIAADADREAAALAAQPVSTLAKMGEVVGIDAKKDHARAHADAMAARPAPDVKFMQDQESRSTKMKAIEAAVIQMESDIEDLTAANVDKWKMTLLPN